MTFAYKFPPMNEFTLDTGLTVICLPDHEQGGLVLAVQLPVGRFSDPVGREGLCELTAGLLSKGSRSFSSEEFAERIENAGAAIFFEIGEEHSMIGLRTLASAASSLVPLFVEMVTGPSFAKEEFVRLQREMITAVKAEAVDPSILATRHFYAEIAGRGHPAGRFQTVQSLKAITIRDVEEFFNQYFSPRESFCIAAGDVEHDRLRRLIAEQLSFWKRPMARRALPAPSVRHPRKMVVRLVNKPDSTQASLAIGHAAPGELCTGREALFLANHIFGSANFSSRLMTRIRTADGKTYGVSSQLLSETEFGTFLVTTSTRNNRLAEVAGSIIEEYRRFCSDGVTAGELEKAKRFATGNMAFQLEGIGNVVDKLLWLRFYGRPNAYIERFAESIAAVTIDFVNETIRRHFSAENLIMIVVGKRAEIEPQLKAFGPIRNFHFRDKI